MGNIVYQKEFKVVGISFKDRILNLKQIISNGIEVGALRPYLDKSILDMKENKLYQLGEFDEQKLGDLVYRIQVDEKTGEFIILMGEKILFRGIEGQFSILNLFTSLNFKYILQQVDELPNDSDEKLDEIKID